MRGLSFHRQSAIAEVSPRRSDIACFVGRIAPRAKAPPPQIAAWLEAGSWPADDLVGPPIPIENWAVFDGIFQWESRTDGSPGPAYLGMAVRSFFAQGGRKCYVVALPEPVKAYVQDGLNESDRSTWTGAGAVLGLPDASYLLMPDLPELVATARVPVSTVPPPAPARPEGFVVCDAGSAVPPPADSGSAGLTAPACDRDGYNAWQKSLESVAQAFLGTRAGQEITIVAALPLPADSAAFGSPDNLMSILPKHAGDTPGTFSGDGMIQVCYPWLKTDESDGLPGQVLPPDGALAGLLARNALTRGSFKSAAPVIPNAIIDVYPQLDGRYYAIPDGPPLSFAQRVSVFGPTPLGFRLLSDVTLATRESHRPAPVRRLISALVRVARETAEPLVFGASGPRLWGQIQAALGSLLMSFWQAGALQGATAKDAFSVRCGRDTMLQADLDAGRVIAQVTLWPAAVVEKIQVTLAVSSGSFASAAAPIQEVA